MDSSSSSSSEDDIVISVVTQTVSNSSNHRGWKGRSIGSRSNINRGTYSWYHDYLSPHPVYPAAYFRRRFRVPLKLFKMFEHDLPLVEPSLFQLTASSGKPGAAPSQKLLSSLRRIGDGSSFSTLDDQARMSVESMRQSFTAFCSGSKKFYGPQHLNRIPSASELRCLEQKHASRGFPGYVGSLDCMYLFWKNCPKAYKGQYHYPKVGKMASIQLEAVCVTVLYCWHVHCGRPGTNNEITVLKNSSLILSIVNGTRNVKLEGGYFLNGKQRNWFCYYLTDVIYPDWAIFAKPNHALITAKEKVMTEAQEGRRKDVERFFGVIQGSFRILRHEFHEWSDETIIDIAETCIIIHNLIVSMHQQGLLDDELTQDGDILISREVVEEFYSGDTITKLGTSTNTEMFPWIEQIVSGQDMLIKYFAENSKVISEILRATQQ